MIVFGFAVLMIISSNMLGADIQNGLLSRLLTTPLRARDFILAYSLPCILFAIIQVILCLGVAALMGMEIHGSLGLAFGILFPAAVCFIGIGMALSTSLIGIILSIVLMILLPIFCGCWIDVASTPPFFQVIAYTLPFTHAADAARAVLIQGAGFSAVATDFCWVIGWTIVCFALGTVLFRRIMVR
jgi:ABC-2 type transport system permease protein